MLSRVDNTAMEKEGVSPKPSRSTSNNPQRSDTRTWMSDNGSTGEIWLN